MTLKIDGRNTPGSRHWGGVMPTSWAALNPSWGQ